MPRFRVILWALLALSVFVAPVGSGLAQGGANALYLPVTLRQYRSPLSSCAAPRSSASSPTYASQHPKVLLNHAGVRACLQQLLASDAEPAARFRALVDAQLAGGNAYEFKAWHAALMYQLTGQAAYADYAIARIDTFVAGEETLIANGQRAEVAFDSYLYIGDLIGDVMLVYDWAYDRLTPTQRSRWLTYANQAVWNVWHPAQAAWGNVAYPWSGWSIDNPVNNHYYSFLRATMLLGLASRGEHPQAQTWIDQFRTAKLENELFPTFNRDLSGGGSREGTGYGTAMRTLFQLYDWWERSTGERIADRTPHTLASIAHMLHNLTPTLDRLAPTGDHARDSSAAFFDYHRDYLLTLIALYPDHPLAAIATSALAQSSLPRMSQSFMYVNDFLYTPPPLTPRPLSDLSPAYWASGTGQFLVRSAWSPTATFSNFICGPYTERHAHHDQGSFVIFNGDWLAYDANIDSHSGIEQGEEMHNLVRIEQNGATVTQVEGAPACQMIALTDSPLFAYALADITPIYNGKPVVAKVEREFLFIKPATFVVFDRVVTVGTNVRKIWTLNTPGAPTYTGNEIRYSAGAHRLDVVHLAPDGLTPELIGGVRTELADSSAGQSLFLNVLATQAAVTSATRADTAGQTGVQLTLADGRSALVHFSNTGHGGTLDLRAGPTVLYNAPLPTTVIAPPLFTE